MTESKTRTTTNEDSFELIGREQLATMMRRGRSERVRRSAAAALSRADRSVVEIELRRIGGVALLDAEVQVVGTARNETVLLLTARRAHD